MSLFSRNSSKSTNGIEYGRNPGGDLGMADAWGTLVKQRKLPARLQNSGLQVWAPSSPRLGFSSIPRPSVFYLYTGDEQANPLKSEGCGMAGLRQPGSVLRDEKGDMLNRKGVASDQPIPVSKRRMCGAWQDPRTRAGSSSPGSSIDCDVIESRFHLPEPQFLHPHKGCGRLEGDQASSE